MIEDYSAFPGDPIPAIPACDRPTKCDKLPPAAVAALAPEASYRKYLMPDARNRGELHSEEILASKAAALAAEYGDASDVKHWLQVGEWATLAANEHFDALDKGVVKTTGKKLTLPYVVQGHQICGEKVDGDGLIQTAPYCNFDARIVSEVLTDDGAENTLTFEVCGTLYDGTPLPTVKVLANEFDEMYWVTALWGARSIIYPGRDGSSHVRTAIKYLSEGGQAIPRRTVYSHTGWRKIDGRYVYLSGGGAIGGTGVVPGIDVNLKEGLSRYILPAPPARVDQALPVQAALEILNGVAPDRIMYPLFCAIWRAVLGDSKTILMLNGHTGSLKSITAAIAQRFWGKTMDYNHLPATWVATSNALESIGNSAADALLTIDDFKPPKGLEMAKYHNKADDFLRGNSNGTGKLRLRSDTTPRPAKPVRALVLMTGEVAPNGESLKARMLIVDMKPDDVNSPRMYECERDGNDGMYAAAMAGFVQWLAPQYSKIKARLDGEILAERDLVAQAGLHKRTPSIVADLTVGLNYFLEYGKFIGAINHSEACLHSERCAKALAESSSLQKDEQSEDNPTDMFLRLLVAALAGGLCHVTSLHNTEPSDDGDRWGWRNNFPLGKRVGWVDGDNLYLEPDLSFSVVSDLARTQNTGFPLTMREIQKRLDNDGLLIGVVPGRQRTVRKLIGGQRLNLLHLKVSSLVPNPDQPTKEDIKACFDDLG